MSASLCTVSASFQGAIRRLVGNWAWHWTTDQITVKLNSETLSIPLTRSKVAALAVGLRKCLETIDR